MKNFTNKRINKIFINGKLLPKKNYRLDNMTVIWDDGVKLKKKNNKITILYTVDYEEV